VQIMTSPPPDRQLVAAAIRHKSRGSLWVFRGMGFVLLLVALVELLANLSFDVVTIGFGLLIGVGGPPLIVRRAAARCWQQVGTPATFSIADRGVQRTDLLTQHSYAWPAVSSVEELPGQLLFSLGKTGFLPMPTGALLPGEREQILATAAQYGVRVGTRS
jgi:hypothetical protein